MSIDNTSLQVAPWSDQIVVPASRYTYEELASIYNESRVDYIVPMPMNARRMEEYISYYDIDLTASAVALTTSGQPTGIAMLGMRDDRAWVTRLGVVPDNRKRKTGLLLTETLLQNARERGASLAQLEVIKGNEPARRLFLKFGFVEQRELLIIRRPPILPKLITALPPAVVTPLSNNEITQLVEETQRDASWVEEARSIMRAGSLKGFSIELSSGECGWIAFQLKAFQISHVIYKVPSNARELMTLALLYYLHSQYSRQDTKIENVPMERTCWPAFQEIGYVEAFRRIEMTLTL